MKGIKSAFIFLLISALCLSQTSALPAPKYEEPAKRDIKGMLQNFRQFQEMLSNAMTLGNMFMEQAIKEEKAGQAQGAPVQSQGTKPPAKRDIKGMLQNFRQFQEFLSNAMTLGNMMMTAS
ncbi:uncharacterized protein VTP21DRAFT_4063 [Calcarisporiella thermophila]|uniref:uncharacterized protein n=1 Tax=Calcarisporiella thermophila TaxID=911321 RepID=UPI0037428F6D